MKVINADHIAAKKFKQIEHLLPASENLWQLLDWIRSRPAGEFAVGIVAEVIVRDEFTHDVVIPFRDVFLVFDTT